MKRARLTGFVDAAAAGELTPAALARIEARLLPEIGDAERRARAVHDSPLLRDVAGPEAATTWERLTLHQRRELVDLLCTVRIQPTGRGRRTFDPASVESPGGHRERPGRRDGGLPAAGSVTNGLGRRC